MISKKSKQPKALKDSPRDHFTPVNLRKAIDYARKHPEISISQIARDNKVDRRTLGRRVMGETKPRNEAHQSEQLFSPGEESEIEQWCKEMDEVGFPINHSYLREMAQAILNRRKFIHKVGVTWSYNFLKRHPALKVKITQYQEQSRQYSAANEAIQRMFYRLLSNSVRRWGITPDRLWNCDEKGITMGRATGKEKCIVRASNKRPTIASNASREFTSVLETVNADKRVLLALYCCLLILMLMFYAGTSSLHCLARKNTSTRNVWLGRSS